MDLFDAIGKRRSIWAYENKPVEKEKLQKLLESANSAPSAGNLQGYDIVVVEDQKRKEALAEASWEQDFIAQAPVVLVFCADAPRSAKKYEGRGTELYSVQDATIACSYAQLVATALGLGTVWIGAFEDEKVNKIINAPEGIRAVAILPVGYYLKDPSPRPRRDLKSLIVKEHF